MRGAGNLYLIFIGLLLCLAGGSFAWLMWRSYERAAGQREWREATCSILQSGIEERQIGAEVRREFRFAVLYGYTFEDTAYTSERYSLRGSGWSGSQDKAKAVLEKYPVGTEVTCYVDPAQPDFAVLKLDSKAPGYSLWFPLLFVVGGLGIMVGAVRNWIKEKRAPASA